MRMAEYEKTCWFCKDHQPADKKYWAWVNLKKVLSKTHKRETYRTMHIDIPRCEACYKVHRRMTWIIRYALAAFFGPVIIMVLGILPTGDGSSWYWLALEYIMTSALIVLVLGSLLYLVTFPKHTHKKYYGNQYPLVLEAKKQGYLGFWGNLFHS
jgi:hypothetical protein